MSGTLAYNMRPQSLLDILGQKHIIGENGLFTKFVEKNHPMSVILYGPPGCGKTTLAMALAHDLNMPCRTFNASTGNKKEMDLIIAPENDSHIKKLNYLMVFLSLSMKFIV